MSKIVPLEFAGSRSGYLTPHEAASYMPLSAEQIRQLCATGQIPCLVRRFASGRVRYKLHRSDIRAWVEAHRHGRVVA